MLPRVSSAGVVVDEHHGLVDCGPRRLDPQDDRFHQVVRSLCVPSASDKNSPVQPPAELEPACRPENN